MSNAIPGTFPPGKTPPRATSHRVADIRQRKPFIVICTCTWNSTASSVDELERLWKDHKRGEAA